MKEKLPPLSLRKQPSGFNINQINRFEEEKYAPNEEEKSRAVESQLQTNPYLSHRQSERSYSPL